MAQRTRRNLSDPRIKKIVKSQINTDTRRSSSGQASSNRSIAFLKLLALFVILISAIAIIVYPNQAALTEFWTGNISSSIKSGATTPDYSPRIHDSAALVTPDNRTVDQGSESGGGTGSQIANSIPAEPLPVERGIQVEVLNGCGVKGLAERLTGYLRDNNIDVVARGNYMLNNKINFDVKSSIILDRSNHNDRAVSIARLLGIPTDRIILKDDPKLQLDVSIILGADYKSLRFVKR